MSQASITNFQGIVARTDSTDVNRGLSVGRGVYLNPPGMLSRPPTYERLWGLPNLRHRLSQLALTSEDKTVLLKIENEGHIFLAFYDCANQQGMSFFYAGQNFSNPPQTIPTLTDDVDLTIQVLWRGLAERVWWGMGKSGGRVFLGNGIDDNLVFRLDRNEIGKLGDHIRPPKPQVKMVMPRSQDRIQATLENGGLLFTATEESEGELGNLITIAIVQGQSDAFSSRLESNSSVEGEDYYYYQIDQNYWSNRRLTYTVICPRNLPTNAQVAEFIRQDPNAFQAVTCEALTPDGTVEIFSEGRLSGGVSPISSGSAWSTNNTDQLTRHYIYLSYISEDVARGKYPLTFSDAGLIEVLSSEGSISSYQIEITIPDDINPIAAEYRRVAIWMRSANTKNTPVNRSAFLYRIVDRAPGSSYVITPSMERSSTYYGYYQNEALRTQIPLPCRYFLEVDNRMLMSGNLTKKSRVWAAASSGNSGASESALTFSYADVPSDDGNAEVRGLSIDSNQALAWSQFNVHPITLSASNYTTTITFKRSALPTGLLNSRCLLKVGGGQMFIGQDYNLYQAAIDPTDNSASQVPKAQLVNGEMADYLKRFCDVRDDQFTHTAFDFANQNWWIWARGVQGYMQTFVFNVTSKQLMGPLDLPGFVSVSQISPSDGRMIGITAAGNILTLDLRRKLNDLEYYDNSSGLTLYNGTDSVPTDIARDDGFGWACKGSQYIRRAQVIQAASGFLRLGDARKRRTVFCIDFTTVRGSAGHVCFKIRNEHGKEIMRPFGEIFGREHHRKKTILSGQDFQWELVAIVGDDKPFSIRDITLVHQPAGDLL